MFRSSLRLSSKHPIIVTSELIEMPILIYLPFSVWHYWIDLGNTSVHELMQEKLSDDPKELVGI